LEFLAVSSSIAISLPLGTETVTVSPFLYETAAAPLRAYSALSVFAQVSVTVAVLPL